MRPRWRLNAAGNDWYRPQRSMHEPARVLVVEDDEAICVLLSTLLTRKGYEVERAKNGAEAIQMLAASSYSAILLDLMMPVSSGFDVLGYLERCSPETIPNSVILLTAVAEIELKKLDHLKFFCVVRKPFELRDLMDVVAACVKNAAREG